MEIPVRIIPDTMVFADSIPVRAPISQENLDFGKIDRLSTQ